MSDADDKLRLCNMILGEIGTRSTMTSVDPPDGSTEAYYCNLLFDDTRDTLLRAAHWGCAGRTESGMLWKALPGTPENPEIPPNFLWQNIYPAPPWLYSYLFPVDQPIQIRRIREQPQPGPDTTGGVPLYTGAISTNFNQLRCARFEVATDVYTPAGLRFNQLLTVTGIQYIVTAGAGYFPGDFVYIETDPLDATVIMRATLQVQTVDGDGGVVTFTINDGGSFSAGRGAQFVPPLRMFATGSSGAGTGFTCFAIMGSKGQFNQRVILTNARNIVIDFTTSDIGVAQWDPGFQNAFMSALGAKLALSLIGDRALFGAKMQEANADILEARVRDGNEALTIQDHVPDWLQVRGVASMEPRDWFFPPYGPLFAV